MDIKQYIVDAFTERVFAGNPAAVCVMDKWPSDELMKSIAIENNLSETAFAVRTSEFYRLRWFTPGGEVDLCGHATLATAYVLLNFYQPDATKVDFETLGGFLSVEKKLDLLEMDFPAYKLKPVEVSDEMTEAFGARPSSAYMGRDLLCVFGDCDKTGETGETIVRGLTPDMDKLVKLPGLIQHVTARDSAGNFDCISRSFAPKLKISEDPVCGSGHCHVLPFWGDKLHKSELVAYQASRRGGVLHGRLTGERVYLSGHAALYSEGVIHVPD